MVLVISVIICAHNPRPDYLEKVLAALKSQTLMLERWELLLIDNASEQSLSSEIDLSWHPQARHIRENQLGLTSARSRGIQSAQTELLIFVDDDNVLDSNYLEIALQISQDFPFIGAWGGRIKGEFEITPPEWTKPYWRSLAIRDFDRDKWSNLVNQYETTPCGAGICVRKQVAQKYVELVSQDSKRLGLDRKGQLLMSAGDSDLAFTACDIGFGIGIFTSLNVIHLIPSSRLNEDYLLRLIEGMAYSHIILHSFREEKPKHPASSWRGKLYEYYNYWKMNSQQKRFYQAEKRGELLAKKLIYGI